VVSNYFGLAEPYECPGRAAAVQRSESRRWLPSTSCHYWHGGTSAISLPGRAATTQRSLLVSCFYGDANFERQHRAEQLAVQPRRHGDEIALRTSCGSLPTLRCTPEDARRSRAPCAPWNQLSAEQIAWLNCGNGMTRARPAQCRRQRRGSLVARPAEIARPPSQAPSALPTLDAETLAWPRVAPVRVVGNSVIIPGTLQSEHSIRKTRSPTRLAARQQAETARVM